MSAIPTFKILFLGPPAVGKTCFRCRLTGELFSPDHKATIGVDFAVKELSLSTGETIQLHIWDMAGQERYESVSSTFYRQAAGALFFFDKTKKEEFPERVLKWKKHLGETKIPLILIGNKSDLPNDFNDEEMQLKATELGFEAYFSVSAEKGINVTEATHELALRMLQKRAALQESMTSAAIALTSPNSKPGNCGC